FFTSWDIVPRHGVSDFGLVRHALVIEYTQRLQLACTPLRHSFNRVVHAGINVITDQLNSNSSAAFKWDVDKLGATCFFDRSSDDLIFLLGTGTAHFELVRTSGLNSVNVGFSVCVVLVSIRPQNELIQSQH